MLSAHQWEVREISYINQTHKALPFRTKATRLRPNQRERERERRGSKFAQLFQFFFSSASAPPLSRFSLQHLPPKLFPFRYFVRVRVLAPQWHFHPHSQLQNLRLCSSNHRLPLPRNFLQGHYYPPLFSTITEKPSSGEGLFAAALSPLMHPLVPTMLSLSPLLSCSRLLLPIVSPDNFYIFFYCLCNLVNSLFPFVPIISIFFPGIRLCLSFCCIFPLLDKITLVIYTWSCI